MAQILTTKEQAAAIERVIRKAENEIYLISYSIKIEDAYIKRIKHAAERNVKIKVIYGESLKKETEKALKEIPNIEIRQLTGLHAKVFANTLECIIGSMNLYDYSEHNNTELGCLLTIKDDKDAFEDALSHCKEIHSDATLIWPLEVVDNSTKEKTVFKKNIGYCIRTGAEIPFNIEKPMSYEAFKSWNKYGDKNHPEKFCHFSGEPSDGKTNVNKPILQKNWKKAKEIHGLV